MLNVLFWKEFCSKIDNNCCETKHRPLQPAIRSASFAAPPSAPPRTQDERISVHNVTEVKKRTSVHFGGADSSSNDS